MARRKPYLSCLYTKQFTDKNYPEKVTLNWLSTVVIIVGGINLNLHTRYVTIEFHSISNVNYISLNYQVFYR